MMDFTVTIKMNVSASSPEEAARFALEDLRDKTIGPWNMEVSCSLGTKTVAAGDPDGDDETANSTQIAASDLPCYAVYTEDYHRSSDWGNKLVALWIATKRNLANGEIRPDQFRDALIGGIIDESDWLNAFRQAAFEVGADHDDDALFEAYIALHRESAFNLIPDQLFAELSWAPSWDGNSLHDLQHANGLQSDHWKSSCIEDIRPGNWLTVFLKMVNQSSADMIEAGIRKYGADGEQFAEKCHAANFVVAKDPSRPSLMTGDEVVAAIENACSQAVPVFHCEVNVKALFESDPTKAMRMTTVMGKVHLGLHEGINGAGYLDTYDGEVVIPADAAGFAGASSWPYGIDEVYGIVKSHFHTTPVAA